VTERDVGVPAVDDRAAADVRSEVTLVGVGASAGGLTALKTFFRAVPRDSGMAYVVIVHLDPDHESRMAELLRSCTDIPVEQISESFTPEPNRVYVIPPNKNLSAVDGRVELAPRDHHAPIDLFFRTLAETQGPAAVGIVLSGTGSDGTLGIRSIREAGGITIAQTPAEAEFSSMPKSAIQTGQVDMVLSAAEMPARIADLKRAHPRLPRTAPAPKDEVDRGPEDGLHVILRHVARRTGRDFTGYKRSTQLRRVARRMAFRQVDTLSDYARLLEQDGSEADRLFQDLLISVSSFFRDPEAFAALERDVVPKLFEGKGADDHVRVWVAGCATGEEAYSIAILLQEHAETLPDRPEIQIFATDLDEDACRRARTGLYPGPIAADVSAERLERFFEPEAGGYRVKHVLRDVVLFAPHDVLQDPPFSKLDLVSCRNLLIYLGPEAQERVLLTFHYGLRPGGYLFLGTAEFAGDNGLFDAVSAKQRIYTKLETKRRFLPRAARASNGRGDRPERDGASRDGEKGDDFSYGALHLRMLEAYAPPSLIVDSDGRVLHLSPNAGRYVRPQGGVPNWNLLDLVSDDLRIDLRAALHEVLEDMTPTEHSVRVEIDGRSSVVTLRLSALDADEGRRPYVLVVFDESSETGEDASIGEGGDVGEGRPDSAEVAHLEQTVRRVREQLSSVLKERDSTVENLRAANEELQSINEQHRTALEEMETSQEELQSLNEELSTVNQEHRATIEQLKHTTADLTNLIEAINVATIFLDRDLNVRRFSPSVTKIFNLAHGDEGRPLRHFTHELHYPGMLDDVARVLSSVESIEREVPDREDRWYSVRMRPYLYGGDRIDGVVITLYEVTDAVRRRDAEHEARERAEFEGARLQTLMDELPAGVLFVEAPSGRIISANERAYAIWGDEGAPLSAPTFDDEARYEAFRANGTRFQEGEWPISRLIRTGRVVRDEEIEIRFEDGRHVVLLVNAALVHLPGKNASDEKGPIAGAIVTFLDITARRQIQEQLRSAKIEAETANRTKGFFMSALSHEFRTPLNGILGYADLLRRDDRLEADQKRKLDRIQAAVRHLNSMIDEILNLVGLDTNLDLEGPSRIDVREIVAEVLEMCDPVAAAAGLTLRVETPDDPVVIATTPNPLRMILVNLVGNAIKFTETGEIRLVLRADEERVSFEVRDTGIGIAPDDQELIFERFWQVSKGLTRSAGGVGIGLSAARDLSHILGGDIEVESEIGAGSVFTLWVPRRPPPVKEPA
jgi:two-component system, chemotaxis family, CheB/CheR fusion protein